MYDYHGYPFFIAFLLLYIDGDLILHDANSKM